MAKRLVLCSVRDLYPGERYAYARRQDDYLNNPAIPMNQVMIRQDCPLALGHRENIHPTIASRDEYRIVYNPNRNREFQLGFDWCHTPVIVWR